MLPELEAPDGSRTGRGGPVNVFELSPAMQARVREVATDVATCTMATAGLQKWSGSAPSTNPYVALGQAIATGAAVTACIIKAQSYALPAPAKTAIRNIGNQFSLLYHLGNLMKQFGSFSDRDTEGDPSYPDMLGLGSQMKATFAGFRATAEEILERIEKENKERQQKEQGRSESQTKERAGPLSDNPRETKPQGPTGIDHGTYVA